MQDDVHAQFTASGNQQRNSVRLERYLKAEAQSTGPTVSPADWKRPGPWIPGMPDNGCFAAGSKVTLADGTAKAIEQLSIFVNSETPGDRVMTLGGRSVSIVDLIHGPEKFPLVALTVRTYDLQSQNEVLLEVAVTEKHPVLVRYNYLVQAIWLQVNDEVHTQYGPGFITRLERNPPDDEVWNLIMTGSDFIQSGVYQDPLLKYAFATNSLLGLTPRDHIIFVNGIALATWPLQTQLTATLRNGVNLGEFS